METSRYSRLKLKIKGIVTNKKYVKIYIGLNVVGKIALILWFTYFGARNLISKDEIECLSLKEEDLLKIKVKRSVINGSMAQTDQTVHFVAPFFSEVNECFADLTRFAQSISQFENVHLILVHVHHGEKSDHAVEVKVSRERYSLMSVKYDGQPGCSEIWFESIKNTVVFPLLLDMLDRGVLYFGSLNSVFESDFLGMIRETEKVAIFPVGSNDEYGFKIAEFVNGTMDSKSPFAANVTFLKEQEIRRISQIEVEYCDLIGRDSWLNIWEFPSKIRSDKKYLAFTTELTDTNIPKLLENIEKQGLQRGAHQKLTYCMEADCAYRRKQ